MDFGLKVESELKFKSLSDPVFHFLNQFYLRNVSFEYLNFMNPFKL